VIERASVVGKVFYRGAVAELAPAELRPRVDGHLLTLTRKELIRRDRSGFAGQDAFRFRHLLLRDAAYAALSKRDRATLHERMAAWVTRTTGERQASSRRSSGTTWSRRPATGSSSAPTRRRPGWPGGPPST
jgi:predicted ATPase